MGRHSQPSRTATTTHRRGALAVGATAALALAAILVPVAQARAAGLLPSTTTVTASPAASTVGDQVVLTATVKVLNLPGLGVVPTGSVAFTSSTGTATTAVGSAGLGSCLLKTCTATLATTALPVGTTSVTGTYSGDLLAAGSSGSAAVTVAPLPGTTNCGANTPCDSGTITSNNGTTTLRVVADPAPGAQTVTATLTDGPQLHCPGDVDPHPGSLAAFTNSASTSEKTVSYTGLNATGNTMELNYANHTSYVGCFASPTPFNGYTSGSYGPAQFVAADGLYEAQLSSCANNSGQKPCFVNINALALSPPYDTYEVHTLPGDPKFIG